MQATFVQRAVLRPVAPFFADYLARDRTEAPTAKRARLKYTLTFAPAEKPDLADALRPILHEHYSDEGQARRLLLELNHPRAASLLVRDFVPRDHSLRLGDLGEIFLVAFVQDALGVPVPVRRLRGRENRQVPLPGDDVVGVLFENDNLTFVKGEAKAHKELRQRALLQAWSALKGNGGRPSRLAVAKIERELSQTNPAAARAVLEYLFKDRKAAFYHVTFTMYETMTADPKQYLKKVGFTHPHYVVGIELTGVETLTKRVFERATAVK